MREALLVVLGAGAGLGMEVGAGGCTVDWSRPVDPEEVPTAAALECSEGQHVAWRDGAWSCEAPPAADYTAFGSCPAGQAVTGVDSATGAVECAASPGTGLTLDEVRAELDAAALCPRLPLRDGTVRRYARDPAETGFVLCRSGADEMVGVGDFWIDRYEAALVPESAFGSGSCDGEGSPYASEGGASPADDYPAGFPDNGNFRTEVFACSVGGAVPSRRMTWFQAEQACALSGKRLCRNDEWQAAVAGTDDPGASDGNGGACVTGADGPRATGLGTECRSQWGAEDMIGNLWEWVAEWHEAGSPWQTTDGQDPAPREGVLAGPWPAGYEDDNTWNVDGRASDGIWQSGLPAAAIRGGGWVNGTGAGAFALTLNNAPSHWGTALGARCCAGVK